MRDVNGNDLLPGSDHEFVVNLYTILLNRWPDEDGYRHYLGRAENRPDQRRPLIDEIAGSQEARNLGIVVRWPGETVAAPPPPELAVAPPPMPVAPPPQAAAASGDLAGVLAQLRDGLGVMDTAAVLEAQRLLAETLAAVARHQAAQLEARIARLEQR